MKNIAVGKKWQKCCVRRSTVAVFYAVIRYFSLAKASPEPIRRNRVVGQGITFPFRNVPCPLRSGGIAPNGRAIGAVKSDVLHFAGHFRILQATSDFIALIACSVQYDSLKMKKMKGSKVNKIRIARPFGVNRESLTFL